MGPGSPICFLVPLYYMTLIYPTGGMPVVQTSSGYNSTSALPQTSIKTLTSFVYTTLPGSVAVKIVVEIEDALPPFPPQTTDPVDIGPSTPPGTTEVAASGSFPAPKTSPMTFTQTADTAASATTPILTGQPRQPTTLLMEMMPVTMPPLTGVPSTTTRPGHPPPTVQPTTGSTVLVSSSSKPDSAEAGVIGGVCGGGLVLVLIGCALCFLKRRRRQRITVPPSISDVSRSSSFASHADSQVSNDLLQTHVEPYNITPALNMGDKFIAQRSKLDETARMKSRLENEGIREETLECPSRGRLAVSDPDTPPDYDELDPFGD